jgi:hypothetical protein
MGLYITFIQSFPCPKCNVLLSAWQCKELWYDGYPIGIDLQKYTLNKKMDGEMHTTCDWCGWVEYVIQKGVLIPHREDKYM